MGRLERIGPPAPPPAVMAILNRFNREELGNTIEVLVALLDVWDGDADAEVTDAEDDFAERLARPWDRPGCAISDPGEEDDDSGQNSEDELSSGGAGYVYGWQPSGPGCPIPDPGGYDDGI